MGKHRLMRESQGVPEVGRSGREEGGTLSSGNFAMDRIGLADIRERRHECMIGGLGG
jgi:hypothetical protein